MDGVSQGFDVYTRKTTAVLLRSVRSARIRSVEDCAGVFRCAEDDYLNFGLSADRTTLKVDANSPLRYQDYVTRFGATGNTILGTFGWQKDGRDSLLMTTKGVYRRAVLEAALPGSTATYVRATYQHQQFFPLDRKLTLALNGEIGIAKAYGNKELPF